MAKVEQLKTTADPKRKSYISDKWKKAFEEGKKADEEAAEARKAAKAAKAPAEPAAKKSRTKAKAPVAPVEKKPKAPVEKAPAAAEEAKDPKQEHQARKQALHNYAGKPTLEASENLQRAYDHFNEQLFARKLPPMLIRFEPSKKFAGAFTPDRWSRARGDEQRVDELVLNPLAIINGKERTERDILATLVHEMCHGEIERQGNAPRREYHCKRWVALMNEIGLEPIVVDRLGNPTGKPTGKRATHKVIDGGEFDLAYQELAASGFSLRWLRLPDPEKEKKKSNKPKTTGVHQCPKCEEKARAKIEAKLICGSCKVKMDPPEVEGGEEESDE